MLNCKEVLIMYRVEKACGWNKYKVQKRFLFFFWFDVPYASYCSKGVAIAWCAKMTEEG